jgi:WD40 repeat protein
MFKAIKEIGTNAICLGITRVPDSERVIVATNEGRLYEYDFAAGQPQAIPFGEGHASSYVTSVAWTPAGVVSGGYDGKLIWWDPDTRQAARIVDEAHAKWIRRVAASPAGDLVASVADDMQIKLWEASTGRLREAFTDHQPITPHHYPSMLYAVAFSPDGKRLATGDKVGHVAVWDVDTAAKVLTVESPGMYTWDPRQRRHSIGGIRSLAFSHDGKWLAVGGIGLIENVDHLGGPARVEVFELASGKPLPELSDNKHKGLVTQMRFTPNDRWLVTAGGDHAGFVTIYDTATWKIAAQDKAHQHIHDFTANPAVDRLYTAHHGRVVAWSLEFPGG